MILYMSTLYIQELSFLGIKQYHTQNHKIEPMDNAIPIEVSPHYS